MKKIISGKKYDTNTAKKVARYEHGGPSEFSYYTEDLYKKRTGEYFLHGLGNAASKYAEECGQNVWQSGQKLIPLTYDRAREWAEMHLEVEEYEAEFGEVSEDEGNVPFNLTVSAQAAASIRRAAQQEGCTIASIIERLAATL